jgi:hypothetical protein
MMKRQQKGFSFTASPLNLASDQGEQSKASPLIDAISEIQATPE